MAKKYKLRGKLGMSQGKAIWRDVGIVIIDENEKQCKVKLDLLPAGEWDGWLMGFPADEVKEDKW